MDFGHSNSEFVRALFEDFYTHDFIASPMAGEEIIWKILLTFLNTQAMEVYAE